MNPQNFLNSLQQPNSSGQGGKGLLSSLAQGVPGGLAGGAAAGGLMALLVGNKKARKFAGKAATVGGAAVVGGLAFKAFQNWQQSKNQVAAPSTAHAPVAPQTPAASTAAQAQLPTEASFVEAESTAPGFEWTLIKAMVAIARIDGNLDMDEQQRIFKSVEEMQLSPEMKGQVFDLLNREITMDELVQGVDTIELKSEVYLASCLAVQLDHPAEFAHLNQLAARLGIPEDFAEQLRQQATQVS